MRWALVAFAALLLLAVAAAVAASQRRAIAERLLLGEIRRAGIEEAALVVEAVSFGELSLADLRLGAPPALQIARLDARYSPGSLWNGYLDELLVSGLRIRASVDEEGLLLGALDALREGDSGGAGALPARKITIADARADLEAPGGAVSLPFELGIDDLGEGRFEAEGSFEMRHPLAEASGRATVEGAPEAFEGTLQIQGSPLSVSDLRLDGQLRAAAEFRFQDGAIEASASLRPVPVHYSSELLRVEGQTPEVDLELARKTEDEPFELALKTRGGRLDLPDHELSAAEIVVSARLEGEGIEGDLRVGELRDGRKPARMQPLGLRGSFEFRDSSVGYSLTLADAGETLILEANGSADLADRSTRAQLYLHPIVLEQEGLQPSALFPFLEGQIESASGTVEATGIASFDGARAAAEIDLALREIGFAAEAADFSRVNGRIQISGPFPPVTPPGQLISIALIDAGLQLTDGLIEFQLRPDGLLDVREAEWRWAGGVVRTEGRFDPTADSQQLALEVEGVDLAELLEFVDLEGLEGSGTLEGEIPLFRRGETVEIRDAELRGAPEGGRIRYRSAAASQTLAGQGYGLEQLLGALDDLHYDVLQLTVDGDTRGEAVVGIHLAGSNPNFEGGRRVEFNMNVEAQLADLLRAGRAAYRVPEVIEKRLEKFQVPEVQ